jgi:hypothetical protein
VFLRPKGTRLLPVRKSFRPSFHTYKNVVASRLFARKVKEGSFVKEPAEPKEVDEVATEVNQTVLEFIEAEKHRDDICPPYQPLATLQQITAVTSSPTSPELDIARVLGWDVAVPKGTFSVGDIAVYIALGATIDSDKPYFRNYNRNVKPQKMAENLYSEGMLLPAATVVELLGGPNQLVIGRDVTEELQVRRRRLVRYLKPTVITAPTGETDYKYNYDYDFPEHIIPRVNELALKSFPECLTELHGKQIYVIKEGLDGESFTLIWQPPEPIDQREKLLQQLAQLEIPKKQKFDAKSAAVDMSQDYLTRMNALVAVQENNPKYQRRLNESFLTICSRNKIVYENGHCKGPPKMINFCRENDWINLFKGRSIAVQGLLCGPNIHKNRMKLDSLQFFVLTVREFDEGKRSYRSYSFSELKDFTNEYGRHGMHMVPIMSEPETIFDATWTVDKFQALANTATLKVSEVDQDDPQIPASGIIVRPAEPFISQVLQKEFSVRLSNQESYDL